MEITTLEEQLVEAEGKEGMQTTVYAYASI
jgi:hypothetical protein